MEIFVKIILLISWIAYAILDGMNDGYFYHYRNTSIKMKHENIHWVYFCKRFIIGALIIWIHSLYFSFLNTSIFGLSLILLFSFFHNGIYYTIRKKLSDKNLYPKGFWSSSTSSEALLELNNISRVFLAVTGAIGIISSFDIHI